MFMRRSIKDPSQKLSGDSQRLASLAEALAQAGSRIEERTWERHLDALMEKLLKNGRQAVIDAALDHVFRSAPGIYEALMESAEAVSESCTIEHHDEPFDALLIAVPILSWTRFAIASGPISSETLLTLSAHLYAHVLAADTRLTVLPNLFAIDQLPHTHAEVFALTQRLTHAALAGSTVRPATNTPETAPFLADTRYLLAVVAAPAGSPLFRWQMPDSSIDITRERQQVLSHWRTQVMPTIERMLPGCGVELLLPDAYYVACREADKQIRPASIRAAVHYLTHALSVEPGGISAIIGGFSDEPVDGRIDEYRISFILHQQNDVVYGVVWPLFGEEEAEDDLPSAMAFHSINAKPGAQVDYATPLQEIYSLLGQCGIVDVKFHPERFPMEACDDCGAPLYCDRQAELVHAEMPEDTPQTTERFH
jgi:hypothetical protein